MWQRMLRWLPCLAMAAALAPAPAEAQTKLLRFPDIHGDRVVFTHAGDLWTAPAGGGDAVRLTTHPGLEIFAKFSPDGNWIAFTGQYDGDEQVYVMPSSGGVPRRLTHYPARGPLPPRWGYDNQVYGWTADGAAVLFRSMRYGYGLTDTRLFTVPVGGGLPRPLPMPVSGAGALSPDGTRVVYSPLTRDFRTWKRYQGGWAQDLYIFDLAGHQLTRVTDHPRSDRDPMWIGERICFASDRDGKLNLFAFDPPPGRRPSSPVMPPGTRAGPVTTVSPASSTSSTAGFGSTTSPRRGRRRSRSACRTTESTGDRPACRWPG